ncbi:MAG: FHA domain-containing protein [Desulfobacterales bacterium]
MSLIGIELSDAGIMAAGSTTEKLLQIDGQASESPGFALPEKGGLLVGKAAESKAHLFPRQIIHHFWNHLNTDPLEQPGQHVPQSTAEIAYNHLDRIWQHIQKHGNEVIIAVPGFYDRQQLGLILGIANELSIPVKGFVPLALAASAVSHPGKMMLHLDIHLHRLEVTYLKQGQQLTLEDSVTGTEKGLIYLHKQWAEAIGQEFVSSTRFDPFHQATSEQELFHRLPGVLYNLHHSPSIAFDMTGGSRTYGITLTHELIARKGESVYTELRQIIEGLRTQHEENESSVVLQLTHRLARLPGCKEILAGIKEAEIFELEEGAGARGALEIWHQLSDQSDSGEISFFTSRPLQHARSAQDHARSFDDSLNAYPTHLLYRNIAYQITDKPLTIGCTQDSERNDVAITGETAGVCPKHFKIELLGGEIVLHDMSAQGTFVDEKRVNGSIALKLGQTIRVGTPGEQLQVIACVELDK